MLGDDLLVRPRHGRIRLMGRWIHFPLKPVDLLLHAHPRFKLGVAADALGKLAPPPRARRTARQRDVRERAARPGSAARSASSFYFPYAWKMWGQGPETLSPIQAKKRVSAGSLGRMVKRVLEGARGQKGMRGHFFYPAPGLRADLARLPRGRARLGATFELEPG